ncbi:MAG TPA: hypothetical protein V6C78_16675 [Crinalium sp.]
MTTAIQSYLNRKPINHAALLGDVYVERGAGVEPLAGGEAPKPLWVFNPI